MARVSFDILDDLHREASEVAAELGVSIADLARSAFDGYLEGVRAARSEDPDEGSGYTVKNLPAPENEIAVTELDGTEEWLSTETDR